MYKRTQIFRFFVTLFLWGFLSGQVQSEEKETNFDQIYLKILNGNLDQAFRSMSADATLNLLTDLGVNILQGRN